MFFEIDLFVLSVHIADKDFFGDRLSKFSPRFWIFFPFGNHYLHYLSLFYINKIKTSHKIIKNRLYCE